MLARRNHGQQVFRVVQARTRGHAPLGGLFGVAGGLAATVGLPGFTTGLGLAITFGAAAGGWALGRAIGGTRQVYSCATCDSSLEATAAVCPACGGTVAGDIARRRDRLDAEEWLEAEAGRAPGHGPDGLD